MTSASIAKAKKEIYRQLITRNQQMEKFIDDMQSGEVVARMNDDGGIRVEFRNGEYYNLPYIVFDSLLGRGMIRVLYNRIAPASNKLSERSRLDAISSTGYLDCELWIAGVLNNGMIAWRMISQHETLAEAVKRAESVIPAQKSIPIYATVWNRLGELLYEDICLPQTRHGLRLE